MTAARQVHNARLARRILIPLAVVAGIGGLAIPAGAGSSSHVAGTLASASVSTNDVVFEKHADAVSNLVLLHGGTETTLDNSGTVQTPDVSPDGSRVVYTATAPSGSDSAIWVVNTDGSNKTLLTHSRRRLGEVHKVQI